MTRRRPSPTVSVIVPTFNAAETIRDQLEALSRQGFEHPWEAIISDNGSTDDTVRIALEWAADHGEFTILDASRRRGASAARNAGAARASAPLLAFCDADDVVDARWLSEIVAALEHADLVAGAVESDSLARHGAAAVSWTTQAPITLGFWTEFAAGATNNLGVRSEVFREIEGFDESLATCEDIDFCWRAQLAGYSFATCPTAVVAIRKRAGRRAVLRQAYHYGRGESLLRCKWADHAERHVRRLRASASDARLAGAGTRIEVPMRPGLPGVRSIGRAGRALARLGSASQQADLLWRCGFRLGLWAGSREARNGERSHRAS